MTTQPWFTGDASALAAAIVRGEFSVRDALGRTLDDLAAQNPRVNAIALPAAALAEPMAAALDAELAACADDAARARLLERRPFFGVPMPLKDVGPATAHRGLPSRMGSRLFGEQGYAWPVDGVLTQRYADAGFVFIGRSTSPEMGISASTEALAYGAPTRNPWSLAHSAGGSSGGAAALTAAGVVTIAHANDGAGSIRIPASTCGLIGFKPSRGLVPCGPLAGEGWGGMTIDHALARSVRDSAAALDVAAGADAGAPYAAPPLPERGFHSALDVPPSRLRIALCNRFFEGDSVHPDVAAAVDGFARHLEALGHTIEAAGPDFATLDVVRPVMVGVATGTAMGLEAIAMRRGWPIGTDEVEPVTWGALQHARSISATDYLSAIAALHALGRRMAQFHTRFDILLTPTLAEPPAHLGRYAMGNPDFIDYRLGPQGLWRYSPFTPLANATGAPSISLPVGRSAAGTPIGALLTAPFGADLLLLRLAAQWEADIRARGGVPVPIAPRP